MRTFALTILLLLASCTPNAPQHSVVRAPGSGAAKAPPADQGGDAPRQKGWSPLHSAVEYQDGDGSIGTTLRQPHPSLAAHFLDKGLPVDSRDEQGRTPLFLAVYHERLDLVKLFIARGADVNARTDVQFTPLMMASISGFRDIAAYLLDHGADPRLRDDEGFTALHWAATQHYPEIVRLLVRKGADVNARNDVGESAVQRVQSIRIGDKGHTQEMTDSMVRLLRQLGAAD